MLVLKPVKNLGVWTHHKFSLLKTVLKSCKDIFIRADEPISNALETSFSLASPQHILKANWQKQFFKNQCILKGNASRITLQFSNRSGMGCNPFFRNDLIWRKARKGHLIAFAGLFLYQEDNQEMMKKVASEYHIYDSVCSNIKEFFPSYEASSIIPKDSGYQISDYSLDNAFRNNGSDLTFNARFQSNKNDFVCDESSFDTNSSWTNIEYSGEECIENSNNDLLVKVVQPKKGVRMVETIVRNCQNELLCGGINIKDKMHSSCIRSLPAHPNVLRIDRAFCDQLHPKTQKSFYRNDSSSKLQNTLYIVTKRYNETLKSYLEKHLLDPGEIMLILIQLLEAVAHLEANNVVHRNITTDNIFIEHEKDGFVRAVLGGFEKSYCASSRRELKVPFQHITLDTRVGDLSTQAPELSSAIPGQFSSFDYLKSDAWLVGCVAYKMLIGRNPFRDPDKNGNILDSRTYKDRDLPSLENEAFPELLKAVTEMLLARDLKQRLSASEAADMLHLELFALPPSRDSSDDQKCCELRNWLTVHYAEAIARRKNQVVPFQLCQSFFNRFDSQQLSNAFRLWLLTKYHDDSDVNEKTN